MLPPADRTQAELAEIWSSWTPEQQAYYEYWLELAKPYEKKPLQAACFALRKVKASLLRSEEGSPDTGSHRVA